MKKKGVIAGLLLVIVMVAPLASSASNSSSSSYFIIQDCPSQPFCINETKYPNPSINNGSIQPGEEIEAFWKVNATGSRGAYNVSVLANSTNPNVGTTKSSETQVTVFEKGIIPNQPKTGHPFFVESGDENPQVCQRSFSGTDVCQLSSQINATGPLANYTVFFIANSTNPNVGTKLSEKQVVEIIKDGSPPLWRNLQDDESGNLVQGQNLDINVELKDEVSGVYKAVLATNSTAKTTLVQDTSTQIDWNTGSFDGSSADRKNNSGELGMGYLNGSKGGQTNDVGLNNESLLAYWRFDRTGIGDGGMVKDYSGRGNDGTLNTGGNTVSGAQGTFGTNSFDLDGSNDDVASSVSPDITGNQPWTISWWQNVDLSETGNRAGWIIWQGPSNQNDDKLISAAVSNGNIEVAHWGNDVTYDAPVDYESWQLVSIVYLGNGTEKVYLNGTLADSRSNVGTLDITSGDWYIGSRQGQNNLEAGMDEVRIYNRSLSSSEVRRLYLNGVDGKFNGNYTAKKIDNSQSTDWNKLEVNADVPSPETNLTAKFKGLDTNGNLVEEQSISISTGTQNYSIDIGNTEDVELVFNGTSSDETKTWEVNSFEVYSGQKGFVNHTSKYGSPNIFSNKSDKWLQANFTYQNNDFRGTLGYRVWVRDKVGNWNVTDTRTQEIIDTKFASASQQLNAESKKSTSASVEHDSLSLIEIFSNPLSTSMYDRITSSNLTIDSNFGSTLLTSDIFIDNLNVEQAFERTVDLEATEQEGITSSTALNNLIDVARSPSSSLTLDAGQYNIRSASVLASSVLQTQAQSQSQGSVSEELSDELTLQGTRYTYTRENLVSYYTFDSEDVQGDTLIDIYGINNGTLSQGVNISQSGVIEEYAKINDRKNITIENNQGLNPENQITVEAWVK